MGDIFNPAGFRFTVNDYVLPIPIKPDGVWLWNSFRSYCCKPNDRITGEEVIYS